MLFRVLTVLTIIISTASCSSWIYKRDIPQGNYLEQRNVDKLQINMTKEQVEFVLGAPVLVDAFGDDTWHYVYKFKSGKDERKNTKRIFIIKFSDGKLIEASGHFKLSENFNTPMDAPVDEPG